MYIYNATYTTFDGEEIEEEFRFNLTKKELLDIELEAEGSIEQFIKRCRNHKDAKAIATFVHNLIVKAYGEKSLDGRQFIKSRNGESLGESFSYTEAFSNLYIELISSADNLSHFINKIVPPAPKGEAQKNAVITSSKN